MCGLGLGQISCNQLNWQSKLNLLAMQIETGPEMSNKKQQKKKIQYYTK